MSFLKGVLVGATGTNSRSGRRFWLAASGALLLVAGGLTAVHYASTHSASSHVRTTAGQQARPVIGATTTVAPTVAAPVDPLVVPPATFTVYLVDSRAAADALVSELTQFERKYDGVDWATSNEMVLVLGSAQERTDARTTLKDLQLEYGVGNVHIHDLRSQ
jgi:hypothetical protein